MVRGWSLGFRVLRVYRAVGCKVLDVPGRCTRSAETGTLQRPSSEALASISIQQRFSTDCGQSSC